MNPSAIFDKAARLIESDGWCQGNYRTPDGRLSLCGAITVAIYGEDEINWPPALGTFTTDTRFAPMDLWDECVVLVNDRLDRLAEGWNDDLERHPHEVIDLLDQLARDNSEWYPYG